MQLVQYKIIIQSVDVIQALRGTHSQPADALQLVRQQSQKLWTLVTQVHVDQMLSATIETGLPPASVYLNILGTLTWPADQNVLSTLIVHQTRLVRDFIVWIHALEFVELMLNAMSEIIFLPARVMKATLEIHSQNVDSNLKVSDKNLYHDMYQKVNYSTFLTI